MREARKLDVLLQSASGLKKVSTSKAYAVAWIDPSVRVPSPAERNHGASPVWNTTMSVSLDERALGQGMSLTIELIGQGLVKTKRIGFVTVDISDIVLEGSKGASVHGQFHAYPVDHQTSLLFLFFLLWCRLQIFLEENFVVPVSWKDENPSLILSFFLSPLFQSANPSGRRSVVPLTESTVFLLSMKVGNFSPILFFVLLCCKLQILLKKVYCSCH